MEGKDGTSERTMLSTPFITPLITPSGRSALEKAKEKGHCACHDTRFPLLVKQVGSTTCAIASSSFALNVLRLPSRDGTEEAKGEPCATHDGGCGGGDGGSGGRSEKGWTEASLASFAYTQRVCTAEGVATRGMTLDDCFRLLTTAGASMSRMVRASTSGESIAQFRELVRRIAAGGSSEVVITNYQMKVRWHTSQGAWWVIVGCLLVVCWLLCSMLTCRSIHAPCCVL